MSEDKHSQPKQDVTRRQFLNYTLMGVGAFMVAGTVTPMLRMAIDPNLQPAVQQDMVAVGDISQFGIEPVRIDFTLNVDDGWENYDVSQSAYVIVQDNGDVLALSPICKHLGCTVQWDTYEEYPEHFFCPCHIGLYDKEGINLPGTPPIAPLDVYRYRVDEDGTLYLGQAVARGEL